MGLAGGLHDALAQADGVTLTESGTGVLTLNGANTCLGSMTLSAGTAQMGIGAAFGGNARLGMTVEPARHLNSCRVCGLGGA